MTDAPSSPSAPQPGVISPTADVRKTAASRTKGDVPQALLDRYLVERDVRGRAERYYRDHRSTEPLFRDRGGSLTTNSAYPDAVADMLKIGSHRGWSQVRVRGDEAFRREVWIRAQPLGIEVRGYRPRDRDRQAAGRGGVGRTPEADARRADPVRDRLARAAVVVARLIPDPVVQARLLERARSRADKDRATTSMPGSSGRNRDR